MKQLRFVPIKEADINLMKKWLKMPHIEKWYEHPEDWITEIKERNAAFSFLKHFIVYDQNLPIGFCQYYTCKDAAEDWYSMINMEDAYSIDYLIGDVQYLGRGYGKKIIEMLIDKIFLLGGKIIVVQPDKDNKPSCGALLSSGFHFDEIHDFTLKAYNLIEGRNFNAWNLL